MQTNKNKKCLCVTILGKTNAGKSTLLNKIVGARVSAVTRKVQTTRVCVRGIHNHGDSQIVFSDVPGIFEPNSKLEKYMMSILWSTVKDSEMLMILLDPFYFNDAKTIEVIKKAQEVQPNHFFVLNKIDLLSIEQLNAVEEKIKSLYNCTNLLSVSAVNGHNLDLLLDYMSFKALPGAWLYGEDQVTDLPLKFWAAEITREHLFLALNRNLPYSLAVITDEWTDGAKKITIRQTVYVNAEGQKAIVLGHEGERIKWVGMTSRKIISESLETPVDLYLNVKVSRFLREDIGKYINYA